MGELTASKDQTDDRDRQLPDAVERVTLRLADETLSDLQRRLREARVPPQLAALGTEDTTRLDRVAELARYWVNGFDWREQERRINSLPLFRATVRGIGVHFLWRRSMKQFAAPLLVTNGWPSCSLEYAGVLDLLSDSFDVVVPTIPGYPLSDPALDSRMDEDVVADLWLELMNMLGYSRFFAHGDDFGGGIVSRIAWRAPVAVRAIQVTEWLEPDRAANLTPAERSYLDALAEWRVQERGYGAVAATRPQTLAFALDDSPTGLMAWLADKYLSWSDPDTTDPWTNDLILTFVTLYWATRSILPSLRLYANAPTPVSDRPVITTPTSVVAPNESRPAPPPEWLNRTYADVRSYQRRQRGGHFMAIEDPEGFVDELRAFFEPFALP